MAPYAKSGHFIQPEMPKGSTLTPQEPIPQLFLLHLFSNFMKKKILYIFRTHALVLPVMKLGCKIVTILYSQC